MDKLKVGWVGAGFVGQAAHLERFVNFPESDIVALAEKRPELCERVITSYNIPKGFKNHQELLKNVDCEAVVAIVNRKHTFQVAKDILKSGKHLLTEKPMAQTKVDAQELVDLANKSGVTYSVGFMRRYDSGVRKVKKIVDELRKNEELGKIISVRIFVEAGGDYCGIEPRIVSEEPKPKIDKVEIAPAWLAKKLHSDYEMFVNVCSHDINLLRFLVKEKPSVTSVDYRPSAFSYVLFDFGSFPGILEWVFRPEDLEGWKEGLEINFEKGKVTLNMPPTFLRNVSSKIIIKRDSSVKSEEPSETFLQGNYSWCFENSDHAFVKHALERSSSDHSGQDSIKDFDIIDEIWEKLV